MRNVVWRKVSEIMRVGYTEEAVRDKIYMVYGPKLSVTEITK